ncbi:MAG TPA: methyltransferase domain-containing protein [Candidatus Deferrimicrobiaceae bacterium]|nr:methyltransferase domain-containing protein [Candidatus Deferrimicrobiaceae bacterium]
MPVAWFETIFDERYPELFGPLEGNAEKEVEEILGLLALPSGSAVEDLGCGRGRHSIPFARRGYRVTGVDLSEKMLAIARARARKEGVFVEWVREDMRVFRRPGAFDLCLSLFTSFGFFNDRENQKVLANMGVSLKEGGTLLLDLRNAGKGLSRLENWNQTIEVPTGNLRMSVRFNRRTKRATAEHVLIRKDGIRISSAFDVRVYSVGELKAMLGKAGMLVKNVFGSLSGEPFTDESGRMVIVSAKE